MRKVLIILCLFSIAKDLAAQSALKSILYDFEGMDLNLTAVPDGAYSYGDLTFKIVANPLGNNDMLGSRSLELNVNWNVNYGAFGKGNSRFVEIDPARDKLFFYFYNPTTNTKDATIDIILEEDDNDNNAFESNLDDQWIKRVTISRSAGWQLIEVPFNSFTDNNTGGNGLFDAGFTGNGGKIFKVEWKFIKPQGETTAKYYMDFIGYSEGSLPHGSTTLDLPSKTLADYCFLGSYVAQNQTAPENAPAVIEGLFPKPPARKIKYVNTFLAFADNGTTPNKFPGAGLQTLIDNGYIPIITWEPFFLQYATSDPVQPKLQDIINGRYDSYIDAMGDKLKTYKGNLIVRLMHEFDGDWYPWCMANNGSDPNLFISAFRYYVDRCRARGATNVKWMWCPNSSPTPNAKFNWMVKAYPGDTYVDYVSTNIYNHPLAGTPQWKSFRYLAADCYYYLTKNFPSKPFIFTEVASRERYTSENTGSETKPMWVVQMDKELQSFFHLARGMISFQTTKEHDWRINSTQASLDSYNNNFWKDDYYFTVGVVGLKQNENLSDIKIFPNPFQDIIHIQFSQQTKAQMDVYSIEGKHVLNKVLNTEQTSLKLSHLPKGIYFVKINSDGGSTVHKIVLY